MKYKVGDKVRVIAELSLDRFYYPIGAILTITNVPPNAEGCIVDPPSVNGGRVVLYKDIEPYKSRRMFNENN
jgi:hypothetical protein